MVSNMPLQEEAQKARDILAAAEHTTILLPPRPTLDVYAAAEAIARALAARAAYVGFLPSVAADAPMPPDAFIHVKNPRPILRERIVAIDTVQSPIRELRYEKSDDRIAIILSPKSAPIREDAFSFREGGVQSDVLIAIGVPDIETVSVEALGLTPQFFTEVPIINIGNAESHTSYGEVNLLSPGMASLSEIAAVCIAAMDTGTLDPEIATVLLAGVMDESRHFAAPVRLGTHLAAAQLLQAGADQARAAALTGESRPLSLLQLIARASVRSKETDGGAVLWSFLTADDFEKTGRAAEDAAAVITALPRFFPAHTAEVLLWQDPATREIRAFVHAPRHALEALAAREPGVLSNPTFAPHAASLNFPEAEERIAALISQLPVLPVDL